MIVIESSGITDVGKKRKGNEDAFFLDDRAKLYIVADGMGGHRAGEVASNLVVENIKSHMCQMDCLDMEKNAEKNTTGYNKSFSVAANRLLAAICMSNKNVYEASQSNKSYRGMGSTVSAVYFSGNTLIAANVGDSPIYLVHAGNIETLSVPHTVLAEQAAISPDHTTQLGNEFKHMLTRAVGIEKRVKADICEVQCFKGDMLVISSDGLSDKVSPEEILGAVLSRPPVKACRSLVDMANQRGGDDNITVIVLKVKMVYGKNSIINLFSRIANRLSNPLFFTRKNIIPEKKS